VPYPERPSSRNEEPMLSSAGSVIHTLNGMFPVEHSTPGQQSKPNIGIHMGLLRGHLRQMSSF